MMKPLAVIGNVNVDLILGPTAPWPTPGTEIIVEHDEIRVGGAAGNSALTLLGLGVDFSVAGNVGDDQFGRWLREAFGARAAKWPVRPEATTLSVGLTHPDGERTFFTTRGHLPRFCLADVRDCLDGATLSGGYALVCGSFLTADLAADYPALFDWADAHGITVALDTGWPLEGWSEENRRRAKSWLARCGCVLMNEVEATSLTGIADPAEAAGSLKAGMPDGAVVVVKCGPDGAIGIDRDGTFSRAAAPMVKVVDTIGAGDAFNAAFLAALASGKGFSSCLEAGVRVASRAISTLPRTYGDPLETSS
jgi:sugar/nucleoside kinase (ribokinase family)